MAFRTHADITEYDAFIRQALNVAPPEFEQYLHAPGPDNISIHELMARASAARARHEARSGLRPPAFLRLIDCKRSLKERTVVLIDDSQLLECSYTAISHTYGGEVYGVFNCDCATRCITKRLRADPSKRPCKGHSQGQQAAVIADVLGMCRILVEKAGVTYAWHDGVCIAQHDPQEVKHFIEHMGWIYANAKDTIIFLHYIGRPMAPISPTPQYLTSRWQTRAWTFQEALLSKRRRYCVRKGANKMEECMARFGDAVPKHQQFVQALCSWYHDEPAAAASDSNTTIIEESDFSALVTNLLLNACCALVHMDELEDADHPFIAQFLAWKDCLVSWFELLRWCCFEFPTTAQVLDACSRRESKHEGDRINSILGLVGVHDFSAHKDEEVEENTMELFKRIKNGLAIAVFATNECAPASTAMASIHRRTWLPSLCGPLQTSYHDRAYDITEEKFHMLTDKIKFEVLEDGNIELQGLLAAACVHKRFTVLQSDALPEAWPTPPKLAPVLRPKSDVRERPYYNVSLLGLDLGDAYIPNLILDDGFTELMFNLLGSCVPIPGIAHFSKYVPIFSCEPIPGIGHFFDYVPIFSSSDEDVENVIREMFGYAVPSADIKSHYKQRALMPTVQEWCEPEEISDWSHASFYASIIFPAKVLDLPETELFFPAILVQGDILHSQAVAKIGCFVGSKHLLGKLQKYSADQVTFLNRVVIK